MCKIFLKTYNRAFSEDNIMAGSTIKIQTVKLSVSPKKITAKTRKITVKGTAGAKVTIKVKGLKAKRRSGKIAGNGKLTFKNMNFRRVKKNANIIFRAAKSGMRTVVVRRKRK